MDISKLIFALKSLQTIVYIQTHDVVSWLFEMDTLTEDPYYGNKEIFMARTSSCGTFEGHWQNALPSEFCDKNVENADFAVNMFDAAYPNVNRGERVIGVIPNANVNPYVVHNLRTFSVRSEIRMRRPGPMDVRTIVLISHKPVPEELRPFCHVIVDRGVFGEDARKLVLEVVNPRNTEKEQGKAAEMADDCVKVLQEFRIAAQGFSASQILEVLAAVITESKLMKINFGEAFATALTRRGPAYRWV